MQRVERERIVRKVLRLLDAAFRITTKPKTGCHALGNRVAETVVHTEGYGEVGCCVESGVIVTGNWTSCIVRQRECEFMARLGRALERAGAAIEWHDEWAPCEDCKRLFRIECDEVGWTPALRRYGVHAEFLCVACEQKRMHADTECDAIRPKSGVMSGN